MTASPEDVREAVERLTDDELSEIIALEASMSPAPWSVQALYAAIRHVQRNTDVMDDVQDYAEEPDKSANLPDRYDGEALAKLRNYLPRLLAELSRLSRLVGEAGEALALAVPLLEAWADDASNDVGACVQEGGKPTEDELQRMRTSAMIATRAAQAHKAIKGGEE